MVPWLRIKLSPACFVHDNDWYYALPTLEAFEATNERLEINIGRIIDGCAKFDMLRDLARYRAVTYQNAVDEFGPKVFWNLKVAQGYEIPPEFKKYIDPDLLDENYEELLKYVDASGKLQ